MIKFFAVLVLVAPVVASAETALTVKYACKGRQYLTDDSNKIVTIWRMVGKAGNSERLAINYDRSTGKLNPDLTFLVAPDETAVETISFKDDQTKDEFTKSVIDLQQPYYGTCRSTDCYQAIVDTANKSMLSVSKVACQ